MGDLRQWPCARGMLAAGAVPHCPKALLPLVPPSSLPVPRRVLSRHLTHGHLTHGRPVTLASAGDWRHGHLTLAFKGTRPSFGKLSCL